MELHLARRTMPSIYLTQSEEAEGLCKEAQELGEAGDFNGAVRALAHYWRGLGVRPRVEGLERHAQAELLLRCGVLTAQIGLAREIRGTLEAAKSLLGESARLFDAQGNGEKGAEAIVELGFCYWRAGAETDARSCFAEALRKLEGKTSVLKGITLVRIATVEHSAGRYADALRVLSDAAHLFDLTDDHALKGRFHETHALVLEKHNAAYGIEDYLSRALKEYEYARHHFEQGGEGRRLARVEYNLGLVYIRMRENVEAHKRLTRARRLFAGEGDEAGVAEVDETRASVYLAQGRYTDAERIARQAVEAQERGEQKAQLAEALTTHGKSLARLGKGARALETIRRALAEATEAGAQEMAGQACLAMIEELAPVMTSTEVVHCYREADRLLAQTRSVETLEQLRRCAGVMAERVGARQGEETASVVIRPEAGCDLKEEVLRFEGALIKRAMEITGGKLRAAARILGFKHHQTLSLILKERHRDLLAGTEIAPAKQKRNIMQHAGADTRAALPHRATSKR